MLDPRCRAADAAIERAFPATGHPAVTATGKLALPWIVKRVWQRTQFVREAAV